MSEQEAVNDLVPQLAPPASGARAGEAMAPSLSPRTSDEKLTVSRFVRQAVLTAAIIALALSSYLLVLKWRGPAAALPTRVPGEERWIPFHAGWIYVYLAPYAIAPPLLGLLSRATFAWFLRRGVLAILISLVIFVALPTRTIRPPAELLDRLGDGLTARLYRHMVEIDEPPANATPSLHVSLSCLLVFALIRDFRRWWAVSVLGIGLIWAATLFTWQHHLIDVLSGALLATLLAVPWPTLRKGTVAR